MWFTSGFKKMLKLLIILQIFEYFCAAYEYGHYPGWTRAPPTVVGEHRRRLWSESNRYRGNSERFVPKFSMEKNHRKSTTFWDTNYGNKKDIFIGPSLDAHFGFQTSYHDGSESSYNMEKAVLQTTENPAIRFPPVVSPNKSSSMSRQPVFFTNPSTGIVYAITEIGLFANIEKNFFKDPKNNAENNNNSNSIPIFITKAQYDQDISLLRQKYESSCKSSSISSTVNTPISHSRGVIPPPSTVTMKPNIIELMGPTKVKMPPSTIVTAKLTVKDPPTSNKRRKLTRKGVNNSRKFSNKSDNADGPVVILGKRKRKTESQLEKPTYNLRSNEKPSTMQRNPIPLRDHRVSRRSVDSNIFLTNETMKEFQSQSLACHNTTKSPTKKSKTRSSSKEQNSYDDEYFGSDSHSIDNDNSLGRESEETYESLEGNKIDRAKDTIKREPLLSTESNEDDSGDEDEDDEDFPSMSSFMQEISIPVRAIMNKISDILLPDEKEIDEYDREHDSRQPKYPSYTKFHRTENDYGDDNDDDSSLGSWLSSWLGFDQRNKKKPISSLNSQSWFESLFGNSERTTPSSIDADDDSDGNWFFGWFDSRRRSKRTTVSTTTTTTTQVPILTIANPLTNAQSWIGILAQHIINSSSTTTHLPFTTATANENSDIPKKIEYDKYQIWRLKIKNNLQLNALQDYAETEEGSKLHWLAGPSLRGSTDVLIPPDLLNDLEATISIESIDHEVLIFDVGKAIAYEQKQNQTNASLTSASPPPHKRWNKYHRYDAIVKYLEQIQMRNPQLIELIHVGRSYEGRPLIIVKIESRQSVAAASSVKEGMQLKWKLGQARTLATNAVFIEAGVRGREWIAPASAIWIVGELLRSMKNNKTNPSTSHIRNTTWYVMPVLNPDGYEYSHEYDRFWLKSRSRHISKPSGILDSAMSWFQQSSREGVCYGVDLNHNWPYHWGRNRASRSPCNQFYIGPSAFSEPETNSVSKFLMDYRKQIKLFISLQSYGRIISFPSKPISTLDSQKVEDMLDVAMAAANTLRFRPSGNKFRYKVDSATDLIGQRSGSSDEFATYELNIPFAYTIHLEDNGVHGYLLPTSQIESTARDAFDIVTSIIDYI